MNLESVANSVLDHCDSTNDWVRKLGEQGFPHGTWVSTRSQEKGRGRRGREWASMEGNLFLSILFRPEFQKLLKHATWIPLAVAVGAVGRILEKYPELRDRLKIKWPNDLWLEDAKLGGILCESVGSAQGSFVVIGIGLNCSQGPKSLDQPTASLSEALGQDVFADYLRAEVKDAILQSVEQLFSGGSSPIEQAYNQWALIKPGDSITWSDPQSDTQGAGTVIGLGAFSELQVCTHSGEIRPLYAEDVKLKSF